jgi:hypothetical protein
MAAAIIISSVKFETPASRRPREEPREGEDVVDLVGVVRASGGDHGGVLARCDRVNLGHWVGQCEDDGVGG